MKELKLNVIEVNQPIGTLYLASINASILCNAVTINRRRESMFGIQRSPVRKRLSEITSYCSDPDATFPTSIIVSVNESEMGVAVSYDSEKHEMTIQYDKAIGEVIDGQHRILGIKEAENRQDFDLPVIFLLNATNEQKSYVFSIINSKQVQVKSSLIFDLFGVAEGRSPQKTVHTIARALNYSKNSPFYHRLKMLGTKEDGFEDATLSQGTFAKRLLALISRTPEQDQIDIKRGKKLSADSRCPFRDYFIQDRDDVIKAIVENCFVALSHVFPDEWDNPHEYILWKSTGYNAIIDSLKDIYDFGKVIQRLDVELFKEIFDELYVVLDEGMTIDDVKMSNVKLTSMYFSSGEKETAKLKTYILEALERVKHRYE